MKDIWLISDTHFNHTNICLKFLDNSGNRIRKQFDSSKEMDECMISNWNEVVKPSDLVYHLGDVWFGPDDEADKILGRLNGVKRLIVGNHDNLKSQIFKKHFQKIMVVRDFIHDHGIFLSHYPLYTDMFEFKSKGDIHVLNVHGHTHEKCSKNKYHKNICVEVTDYKPVHIENVRKQVNMYHGGYMWT